MAWMTAMVTRAKKPPAMKSMMVGEAVQPIRQSVKEQGQMLVLLSQRYGGKVRKAMRRG